VVEKMAEFEVRLADYVAFLPNFFQITGLRPPLDPASPVRV